MTSPEFVFSLYCPRCGEDRVTYRLDDSDKAGEWYQRPLNFETLALITSHYANCDGVPR